MISVLKLSLLYIYNLLLKINFLGALLRFIVQHRILMIFCILRYTIFSGFFQFLIPIIIITVIYLRILLFLKVKKHKILKVYLYIETPCFSVFHATSSFCRGIGFLSQACWRNRERRTPFFSQSLSSSLSHGSPLGECCPFCASYLFQEIFHLAKWPHCSLFCLVTEMTEVFESTESMMTVYLVFHLIGVSSCCTNPILYGFLNDNFQKVSP